jgi:hypothetical protein
MNYQEICELEEQVYQRRKQLENNGTYEEWFQWYRMLITLGRQIEQFGRADYLRQKTVDQVLNANNENTSSKKD